MLNFFKLEAQKWPLLLFSSMSTLPFGDSIQLHGFNHYQLFAVNSQIYISAHISSPKLLTHLTNCQHDFSPWIINIQLQFSIVKCKLLISNPKPVPYSSIDGILLVAQIIHDSYLSLIPHTQSSMNPINSTFMNIRSSCYSPTTATILVQAIIISQWDTAIAF